MKPVKIVPNRHIVRNLDGTYACRVGDLVTKSLTDVARHVVAQQRIYVEEPAK